MLHQQKTFLDFFHIKFTAIYQSEKNLTNCSLDIREVIKLASLNNPQASILENYPNHRHHVLVTWTSPPLQVGHRNKNGAQAMKAVCINCRVLQRANSDPTPNAVRQHFNSFESCPWNSHFLHQFSYIFFLKRFNMTGFENKNLIIGRKNEVLTSSRGSLFSLSPSILTLTTPDLSTISWITFPFFPITFPSEGKNG